MSAPSIPRAWPLFLAAARLEAQLILRSRAFLVFTFFQALAFLALVSLFGLTGSMAPTALVDNDGGPQAVLLAQKLAQAHHSFRLLPMTQAEADRELRDGHLVAAITIPAGFSAAVNSGQTRALEVEVDNVDKDLTDDIERALPSAIVAFGAENHFPGIRLAVVEHDLLPTDTGYIPYLAVSAIALDALVLAAILGAVAVAREFEAGTVKFWRLAPASAWPLLAGKLAAAAAVAALAIGATTLVVVFGYGVHPLHPVTLAAALLATVVIFAALGAALGVAVRRTLPLVPLVFGLAMPLYIDSGSLEPARFDGEVIWAFAHLSPVYYAIGVLQWAFHGLLVTPEPPALDLGILAAIAALAAGVALLALRRVPAR